MKLRTLGASGLQVSLVGLGCNNFAGRIDKEASRAVIHKTIDLGITLFDTADVYGEKGASESILGDVLGERHKACFAKPRAHPPAREKEPSLAAWNVVACAQDGVFFQWNLHLTSTFKGVALGQR